MQTGSLFKNGDQPDLLWWLENIAADPKPVYLNHGEVEAAEALKQKVEKRYHWSVTLAEMNNIYR